MADKTFEVFGTKVDRAELAKLLSDRDAFDDYYKNKKISNSEREETWRRLNILRRHLIDGTGGLTTVIDDNGYEGLDNTAGLHNIDEKGNIKKGADAYATSYFLRKAKGMSAYEEPKKEPDKSKIKYSDTAIGTAMNRYLYGRDNGDIQDFLDLDELVDNKRANTNRSKKFKEGLENILQNWDNIFEDFTEELKNTAKTNISNIYSVFDNDGVITDNEYLDLGKATGMTNLRKMFNTDFTPKATPSNDDTTPQPGRTYADFIKWVEQNYAPYTGNDLISILAKGNDTDNFGENSQALFNLNLKNASTEDLLSFINTGLNGGDVGKSSILKGVTSTGISPGFYLNSILEELKEREGGLYNFGENDLGKFYIPLGKSQRNTGFVWDTNAGKIREMSIHNIPYWQKIIKDQWDALGKSGDISGLNPLLISAYSQFKEGGILKALPGAVMNRIGSPSEIDWLNTDNNLQNAKDLAKWNEYYKNADIDNDIKYSLLGDYWLSEDGTNTTRKTIKPWTKGYLKDNNGKIITDASGNTLYGLTGALLAILLNKLESAGSKLSWDINKLKLNTKGYNSWNELFNQTGFNEYFGNDTTRYDYMGPSTYNRHAFLERLKKTYNNRNNVLNIGDDRVYWNGKQWVREQGKMIDLTPKVQIPTEKLELKTIGDGSGYFGLDDQYTDDDFVGGSDPDNKGKGINWDKIGQYAADYIPEAINTAMLFNSLHTNQKNWETIDNAIQPKLKVHTFTPRQIVGRYSKWQNELENAAETENVGDRVADTYSDASLGAATRLQANVNANKQRTLANTAYDESVRESQEKSWQNVKDFLTIKDEDMFFNHSQRVDSNLAKAQNTAQKRQADQQSLANYGKALLSLYWYRKNLNKENLQDQYDFEKDVETQNATLLVQLAQDKFNKSYYSWLDLTDDSGKEINKGKTVTEFLNTAKGQKALRWIDQATQMNNARLNSLRSRIFNYNYTDPYNGKYEISYSKKGSKLIPRKTK